ncbi:hypothetical protein LINGRAHAP2_LOCUS8034, partial [Linum grandiflorum]
MEGLLDVAGRSKPEASSEESECGVVGGGASEQRNPATPSFIEEEETTNLEKFGLGERSKIERMLEGEPQMALEGRQSDQMQKDDNAVSCQGLPKLLKCPA